MSEQDAAAAREWEAALDRLELQLNRAERIGTPEAKDVDLGLPDSLSTIPRYLLARAQSLIELHQRVAEPRGTTRPPLHSPEPPVVRGGTLHDRVGHLVTGPREPVSFDLFGEQRGEAGTAGQP